MEHPIDLAHSELNALVTKAARGAGMSWGLAEEAGWAAEWLSRRGLPAAAWAAEWLAQAVDGRPTPVQVGVAFADALPAAQTWFPDATLPDGMSAPGYLLPFLHLAATRFGQTEIIAPLGLAARMQPDGTATFGHGWSNRTAGWRISIFSNREETRRAGVSVSVIDCLHGLALSTTVPPSDTSRNQAGSSSTDND
ncbi:MAG: DUF3726 domain-containing protein [Pseudomonadota bacterium]